MKTQLKMTPFILLSVFLTLLRGVKSHAFLTKPISKQGGDETAYQQSPATQFGLSAFWLDRSYFDNDSTKKPFSRPGEFSYKDANTCCGVKQVFHPCGCQSSDISSCAGVGQARGFGELIGHDSIVPEKVAIGDKLKTKFFMHVNHAGGYAYSLCPKSEYDRCFNEHTPTAGDAPDSPKTLAYLKCVWDCFEANPLSFTGDQMLQLRGSEADHVKLNAVSKTGRSGDLTTTFREVPIEDTNDSSGSGWKYAQSFSNAMVKDQFTADFAPGALPGTSQPRNWQVVDEVQIPNSGLAPGEYLLSWRYDCGTADQLWSNCADVELVVGGDSPIPPATTNPPPQTTPTTTTTTTTTHAPTTTDAPDEFVMCENCAGGSSGHCKGGASGDGCWPFLDAATKLCPHGTQPCLASDAPAPTSPEPQHAMCENCAGGSSGHCKGGASGDGCWSYSDPVNKVCPHGTHPCLQTNNRRLRSSLRGAAR